MKNKTDKFLFIGMIFVCIFFTIGFTFISVTAMKGPQKLNDQEILYYTEVANKIRYSGTTQGIDSSLQYKCAEDTITISSYNMFKQTVTVLFTGNEPTVMVNEPNISFIGCSIFFLVLGTISLVGVIIYFIATIKEFQRTKIKRDFTLPFLKESQI